MTGCVTVQGDMGRLADGGGLDGGSWMWHWRHAMDSWDCASNGVMGCQMEDGVMGLNWHTVVGAVGR